MSPLDRAAYFSQRAAGLIADAELWEQRAESKRKKAAEIEQKAREQYLLALERMQPEGRA